MTRYQSWYLGVRLYGACMYGCVYVCDFLSKSCRVYVCMYMCVCLCMYVCIYVERLDDCAMLEKRIESNQIKSYAPCSTLHAPPMLRCSDALMSPRPQPSCSRFSSIFEVHATAQKNWVVVPHEQNLNVFDKRRNFVILKTLSPNC